MTDSCQIYKAEPGPLHGAPDLYTHLLPGLSGSPHVPKRRSTASSPGPTEAAGADRGGKRLVLGSGTGLAKAAGAQRSASPTYSA